MLYPYLCLSLRLLAFCQGTKHPMKSLFHRAQPSFMLNTNDEWTPVFPPGSFVWNPGEKKISLQGIEPLEWLELWLEYRYSGNRRERKKLRFSLAELLKSARDKDKKIQEASCGSFLHLSLGRARMRTRSPRSDDLFLSGWECEKGKRLVN